MVVPDPIRSLDRACMWLPGVGESWLGLCIAVVECGCDLSWDKWCVLHELFLRVTTLMQIPSLFHVLISCWQERPGWCAPGAEPLQCLRYRLPSQAND